MVLDRVLARCAGQDAVVGDAPRLGFRMLERLAMQVTHSWG
jgi:hypothetical protein